jgi:prepilin-type N-terminal cleavage/methylation domain-containing protein
MKGFTLIELIIVIAIIAILAAILIPTMIGWISKSKLSNANANAKNTANAAGVVMSAAIEAGVAGVPGATAATADKYYYWIKTNTSSIDSPTKEYSDLARAASGFVGVAPSAGTADSFISYMKDEFGGLDQGCFAFSVNNRNKVTAAAFAKAATDEFVGTFPNATAAKIKSASIDTVYASDTAAAEAPTSTFKTDGSGVQDILKFAGAKGTTLEDGNKTTTPTTGG